MRVPTLSGEATRIIAHRGASGPLPEHTLAAYARGVRDGADIIEPDLVMSKDGQLIVRHDHHLSRSTDIGDRPEFADRRREGGADARMDWWVEDFTRAELATLRALQPFADREQSWNGHWSFPDFNEVLTWWHDEHRQGHRFGLYPEIKHPNEFVRLGLDATQAMIDALHAQHLSGRGSPVWVQCFEMPPLARVRESCDNPVFALFENRLVGDVGWLRAQHAKHPYLDGIAVHKSLLIGEARHRDLVAAAHDLGWALHVWTLRDDQVGAGFDRVEDEMRALLGLGVDAMFCDFPATAVAVRAHFMRDL